MKVRKDNFTKSTIFPSFTGFFAYQICRTTFFSSSEERISENKYITCVYNWHIIILFPELLWYSICRQICDSPIAMILYSSVCVCVCVSVSVTFVSTSLILGKNKKL